MSITLTKSTAMCYSRNLLKSNNITVSVISAPALIKYEEDYLPHGIETAHSLLSADRESQGPACRRS